MPTYNLLCPSCVNWKRKVNQSNDECIKGIPEKNMFEGCKEFQSIYDGKEICRNCYKWQEDKYGSGYCHLKNKCTNFAHRCNVFKFDK